MLHDMRRSSCVKGLMASLAAFSLALACSSGSTGGDAGMEGGNDSSNNSDANNGNDTSMCGVMLCVENNVSPLCPSCSPMSGDICSPPAAITCNYTNGCSGAQLQSSQCTCELPDAAAGDASDAGSTSGNAYWSCKNGT
jgi:hypothetical protein